MKNLMNLKGAKVLNRIEQKAINGGAIGSCVIACSSGVLIDNVSNCNIDIKAVCANQQGPYFEYCTCPSSNT